MLFRSAGFSRELEKLGFKVREARASTGKLNGYYVTSRSGTEYKASEIQTKCDKIDEILKPQLMTKCSLTKATFDDHQSYI